MTDKEERFIYFAMLGIPYEGLSPVGIVSREEAEKLDQSEKVGVAGKEWYEILKIKITEDGAEWVD